MWDFISFQNINQCTTSTKAVEHETKVVQVHTCGGADDLHSKLMKNEGN